MLVRTLAIGGCPRAPLDAEASIEPLEKVLYRDFPTLLGKSRKVEYGKDMRKTLLAMTLSTCLIAASVFSLNIIVVNSANAATIKCIGKDKVAGVCLPKNRKKWSISVENNYLLACVNAARTNNTLEAARAYCGCTIVGMEKYYSEKAFAAAERKYSMDAIFPQRWTNILAACQQ